MELFPEEQIIGVFRGFREGGLEFHADLVLPYQNNFQRIPMHGQFVLVQLETPEEAILGRITSFSSEGKLSYGSGEEFNIRAVKEQRSIPEDLREQYLKYRVNIRVLGVLGNNNSSSSSNLTFVPSHRRLPHVGSAVAFPSGEVLREICGHNIEGADIGLFALGEYIYAHDSKAIQTHPWMHLKKPEIMIRFPVANLVSRRSFVFARAGFGKSNLNKLLFSKLYETTPTVTKRGNREEPVGTIIFDPDGEYFWPDDKGRPGLCDVPHLRDKLVVFTDRGEPSPYYGSFVAGGIKLDIRQLRPGDVISIALPSERQDQQNVAKLRSLSQNKWTELVDLIDRDKGGADLKEIARIMNLDENRQEAEAVAARSNMTNIVGMLHDRSSQFMEFLMETLKAGKICVVDISRMHGTQSFILAGIILRRIFNHNQQEFTKAEPQTIPVIAVIEEAQAVLNERATSAEPYIAWVKEGRKYDLGALLITQQPGAIPNEILSQGDNWFIFHLLSSGDLANVKRANSHFSDDMLSSLLNEPIPGQGVFWSSVDGKAYPVPFRALSFEDAYKVIDPEYSKGAISIFATKLRSDMESLIEQARTSNNQTRAITLSETTAQPPIDPDYEQDDESPDLEAFYRREARYAVENSEDLINRIKGIGAAWGHAKGIIMEALPKMLDNKEQKAYHLVAPTMEAIFGEQNKGWHSFRNERGTMCIKIGPKKEN